MAPGGRRRAALLLGLLVAAPAGADWRGRLAWWIQQRRLHPTPPILRLAPLPPGLGRYSSGYGWRQGRLHRGVDLLAPAGTPVAAVGDGRVAEARWSNGYGHVVLVEHAGGLATRYAHLLRAPAVQAGDRVEAGDPLGEVGASGNATTPHLHLEVLERGEAVDPRRYLDF